MPVTRRVGSVEITALTDAEGPFFSHRHEAFPTADAEQFAAADAYDPGSVTDDGRWWLKFRAFAIRGESGVTMVDTGIGPADSPASTWAPVPGELPAELAAAGISPEEVTTVVLTHLHTDHVGWAVTGARPFFPNARYLLQTAEYEAVDALNPGLREHLLEPLRSSDQLCLVDGDEELADTIRVVATPGHTPGHQSVLVGHDDPVAVTGDLLVHPVQLLYPDVAYSHESDPDAARESRLRLLAHIAINSGQLATPHLTMPFVEVPSTTRLPG